MFQIPSAANMGDQKKIKQQKKNSSSPSTWDQVVPLDIALNNSSVNISEDSRYGWSNLFAEAVK